MKKREDESGAVVPMALPAGLGPVEEPEAFDVAALKESVAAHQAECGCHPFEPDHSCCDDLRQRGSGVFTVAQDSSGEQWHVDWLCKVRPEARR